MEASCVLFKRKLRQMNTNWRPLDGKSTHNDTNQRITSLGTKNACIDLQITFKSFQDKHDEILKTLESLNGGFANGGLRYSSTIVHDCLKLSSFCDENSLYERPRKCTIAHDCAQIAECGLKPPFESPHLDFPEKLGQNSEHFFREENSKRSVGFSLCDSCDLVKFCRAMHAINQAVGRSVCMSVSVSVCL